MFHLQYLLFFLPLVNSWCSPSDTGECNLIIRGGRKSKDTDYRTISFLKGDHSTAGMIRVLPSTSKMSFWTGNGNEKQPHLSLDQDGTVNIAKELHIHNGTLFSNKAVVSNITAIDLTTSSIRTSTLQVNQSITATSSIFGNTNITSNLQVHGGLTVSTASMFTSDVVSNGNVHADHLNEKSGAYLDKTGSVEIYSSSNDAHLDFKNKRNEDSVVRIGIDTDKLLLHGRHMIINNQGQVGIGTEPTHTLHINGIVRAASSTISTGSDRRVKQDIQDVDVELSLARIASLKVRNFAWHPAYKHTTKQRKARKTGFIAQELIKIIPEAVEKGKGIETFTDENGNTLNVDGMHTVNMDAVVMDLIGSVQALQKQVAMLTEMLNTSNCTRIPKVPIKKTNDFKHFKPFVLGLKKT